MAKDTLILPVTGTELPWKPQYVLWEGNSKDPEEPGGKKTAGRP